MTQHSLGVTGWCEHCKCKYPVADEHAGAVLQCDQCGSLLVISYRPQKPHAQKPQAQHETIQAHAELPVYGVPIASEETNGLAVAGFILAMISFCFGLLLSPIALGCSVAGLRKTTNRGYAIAGTIVSFFQIVILILGGLWIYRAGIWIHDTSERVSEMVEEVSEKAEAHMAATLTEQAIDRCVQQIDGQAVALGELPSKDEGTSLVKFNKDGWGRPMRYELTDGRIAAYTVRSSGPDDQWDTDDDIGRTVTTPVPSNTTAAIVLLKDSESRRQKLALMWLMSADPVDDDRKIVIEAIAPFTRRGDLRSLSAQVIARWADSEQMQQMAEANEVDGKELVEAIAETREPKDLLPFVNDDDLRTRTFARQALERKEIPSSDIVAQILRDLKNENRVNNAVAYLNDLKIDKADASEIRKAILEMLEQRGVSGTNNDIAISVLRKTDVNESDLPALMRVFVQTNHDSILAMLNEHIDDEMSRYFLEIAKHPGSRATTARRFFINQGPAAEPIILNLLKSDVISHRLAAIDILEKIGTERSIPALTEAEKNPHLSRAAKKAIDAIDAANRQPVDAVPAKGLPAEAENVE